MGNYLLEVRHNLCILLTWQFKENKGRSAFNFPWAVMVELAVTLLCSGPLLVGSVHSGPGDHCHGCYFQYFPFLFVKRSYYAEQPWYAAAKIHIPENECLVSHCGEYWLDISLAWKPYTVAYHIKGHTPHTAHSLLSACILTHWHQSLYCFNPIQYDAELSFTTTHSLTITPYSSNLPTGPL